MSWFSGYRWLEMHRIAVVGNSGSGKSTLALRMAKKLEYPFLELDSIYHQPGWEPLPEDELRARVADFALQQEWIIDGNYSVVRDLIWPAADTLVWLDLPRRVVMKRVLLRTLKRGVTREELWNGNREPLSNFISFDPETNVVAWAWTRHDSVREKYESALARSEAVHLKTYRLQSAGEVESFLSAIPVR